MKKGITKIFIHDIYAKAPKKKSPFNSIIYNHIDEIWSIDRVDMVDYKISKNKR